jgi:hypothetical protein
MTTPEPLLTDNEATALRVLLLRATNVEITLPAPQDRSNRDAWFCSLFCAFASRRALELEEYRRRKLCNPRG